MHNSLLITLLIGAVAGWLAGMFVRGSGYGIIGDIIVGVLGGVAGRYLFAWLGFAPHLGSPLLDQGLIALVGAVVLLLIIGLLRPRSIGERVQDVWRRRCAYTRSEQSSFSSVVSECSRAVFAAARRICLASSKRPPMRAASTLERTSRRSGRIPSRMFW